MRAYRVIDTVFRLVNEGFAPVGVRGILPGGDVFEGLDDGRFAGAIRPQDQRQRPREVYPRLGRLVPEISNTSNLEVLHSRHLGPLNFRPIPRKNNTHKKGQPHTEHEQIFSDEVILFSWRQKDIASFHHQQTRQLTQN